MGFLSNNIFIIFFIIFMPFYFQNTRILIAQGLWIAGKDFHGLPLNQLVFMEKNGGGNQRSRIKRVAGVDESEEKEIFIVEKFRALLGFKNPSNADSAESFSPSPSPLSAIEAPAPAPVPSFPTHSRSHPPLHHSRGDKTGHKEQPQNKDEANVRTLVAFLVPTGAAILICALGFFWVCNKFRKKRKKSIKTISVTEKKGVRAAASKSSNPQKSDKNKVSSNHGLDDLFYLNSLEMDLEQQSSYAVKTSINHNTPEFNSQEILCPEKYNHSNFLLGPLPGRDSNSSSKEIRSIHEDETESIKFESDCADSSFSDRILSVEMHLSDSESFHSLVDSHSSMARLSNASKASHSDASEILTENVINMSPRQPETTKILISQPPPPPPAPPPPPPPPLPVSVASFSSSRSSPYSTRIGNKASSSSTLPYFSSPLKLDSSPGSIPTPRKDLTSSIKNQAKQSPPSPPTIPPPPCPPGNNFSIKTPPPLPSQLPHFAPLGKDGSPLPKLKPLHWDKVRATPDRSMVWDKLHSSSFELDEEMIESLFGYNLQNSAKNDDTKSKSPSPNKHILEPKRLQNLTILFKALNVTAEQVCEALEQGNGLRLAQIEALVKMVPTMEEEVKLSSYKGNFNDLGSAERFVIVVLRIPFAFQRVEAMLYRETFEDEVVHLRNSFSMLEDACKELRSSRLFLKLLEAVLKTGNRMNVGTIRGGAKAFKLDALLKLADVKGTDGKTTLLHFVVQEIIRSEGIRVSESIMGKISQKNKSKTAQEKEEYYRKMGLDLVSGLSTELYNVKKTASIDMDVLATSVSYLSEGIAKLLRLVHKDLCVDQRSETFINSMKYFTNYAESILKELREDENKVLLRVKEITEYFHGDLSREEGNPLRIFVIVRDFLGMLDHVCKELRSSKAGRSRSPLAPFR